jgi:hypothetical protein
LVGTLSVLPVPSCQASTRTASREYRHGWPAETGRCGRIR